MECSTFTRETNFVFVAVGLNQQWLGQFVSVLSTLRHAEIYDFRYVYEAPWVRCGHWTDLGRLAASLFENPLPRYLRAHHVTHYCSNVHTVFLFFFLITFTTQGGF